MGLAQKQERNRPNQDRLGDKAKRFGLREFPEWLVTGKPEDRSGMQFRYKVMVIGIEPFRHFQRHRRRLAAVTAGLRLTARHLEISGGIDRAALPAEALRNGPHQHGRVEHLVVIAEVVRWNEIDAGRSWGAVACVGPSSSVTAALPSGISSAHRCASGTRFPILPGPWPGALARVSGFRPNPGKELSVI